MAGWFWSCSFSLEDEWEVARRSPDVSFGSHSAPLGIRIASCFYFSSASLSTNSLPSMLHRPAFPNRIVGVSRARSSGSSDHRRSSQFASIVRAIHLDCVIIAPPNPEHSKTTAFPPAEIPIPPYLVRANDDGNPHCSRRRPIR